MRETATRSADGWVYVRKAKGERVRQLVCLPPAGSGWAFYRTWHLMAPEGTELLFLEYPGRAARRRERPRTNLVELSLEAARAVEPLLRPPFAMYGHSMGALVAYEMCRQWARSGGTPSTVLFAAAAAAPGRGTSREPIHKLPKASLFDYLSKLGAPGTELSAYAELLETAERVLRADFEACETYSPDLESPLGCPISVFGGVADHMVAQKQLLAWRGLTASSFRIRMLRASHFFDRRTTEEVVATVGKDLDEASLSTS